MLTKGIKSAVVFVLTLGVVAFGASACTSNPTSAKKMAFCAAFVPFAKLNAAILGEPSLGWLKAHQSDLHTIKNDAPSGGVGQIARLLVQQTDTYIKTNNPNDAIMFNSATNVDVYCGVDMNGNPLPAYFSTGKRTAFCATFLPVWYELNITWNPAVLTTRKK